MEILTVDKALAQYGLSQLIGKHCAFVANVFGDGRVDIRAGVVADPDSCVIDDDRGYALVVEVPTADDFVLHFLTADSEVLLTSGDTAYTDDAQPNPTAADYRELQRQHDALQTELFNARKTAGPQITIEQAKRISADVVCLVMSNRFSVPVPADVVERCKSYSLAKMDLAGKMMNGQAETLENGGQVCRVSCTSEDVAEVYLRLHKGDAFADNDLTHLCAIVNRAKGANFGIVLDESGSFALLRLDQSGTGGESVISQPSWSAFKSAFLNYLNN